MIICIVQLAPVNSVLACATETLKLGVVLSYSCQITSFEDIEHIWWQILEDSFLNSIFVTPSWQKTWWNSMGSETMELVILSVREDDKVIGIGPLVKDHGIISFLGSTDVCDLHDFVVLKGYEEKFFETMFEYLIQDTWDEIKLESVLSYSPTLVYMESFAKKNGYKLDKVIEDKLVGVALPDSWDEYLSKLRKKDRHELRRKLRRLESESDFYIERFNDPDQIMEAIDDFLDLMAQSRDEKAEFLDEEKKDFFKYMTSQISKDGHVSLFFLKVSGVRTATTICFDYNNERSLYNSGYNTDYAELGTGFLLKALCLKMAIEEGMVYYDLLRGTESYKYHLGAEDRDLFKISLTR